jgi:hypothetical protein
MNVTALQYIQTAAVNLVFSLLEQILASKCDVGVFRCAKRNTTVPKVIL